MGRKGSWLAGAAAIAASFVAIWPGAPWPLSLFAEFRPHLLVACGLLATVALALRLPRMALGLAFLLILNAATLRVGPFITAPARSAEPGVTILWANVFGSTQAFERTLAYARAEGADVIAFGETPAGAKIPDDIGKAYPYSARNFWDEGRRSDRVATSRLLILSKRSISNEYDFADPEGPLRSVYSFELDGARYPLNLIVLHAFAPFTPDWAKRRDAMLDRLPEVPRGPFVIVGDLNATPWSPSLANVPGRRVGSPWRSTWLSDLPLLGLPIDHFFASEGVRPLALRVGPALGSDHRPILAKVRVEGDPVIEGSTSDVAYLQRVPVGRMILRRPPDCALGLWADVFVRLDESGDGSRAMSAQRMRSFEGESYDQYTHRPIVKIAERGTLTAQARVRIGETLPKDLGIADTCFALMVPEALPLREALRARRLLLELAPREVFFVGLTFPMDEASTAGTSEKSGDQEVPAPSLNTGSDPP